ncbi:uncharacterized protein BJ171DRAFT_7613 [Polychytrium aggregatum]|uniref:uncharacterized protein n=1 Tax=Polychytrium aggregatum TaxID=110093 RepID=UPI0022FF0668|nr:uncharacterized protein BJ171DRAFT_7613 [Polychytrium aggregatum]KAI9209797.1 hypothetical protein BJ171DRAFT_7613 [Polychytrium aggregatum]
MLGILVPEAAHTSFYTFLLSTKGWKEGLLLLCLILLPVVLMSCRPHLALPFGLEFHPPLCCAFEQAAPFDQSEHGLFVCRADESPP